MRRRGLLGLLGGAVVAGPSMAKQAIASGLEGLSMGQTGLRGLASAGVEIGGYVYDTASKDQSVEYDPVAWAKRDLAEFIGRPAADLARERMETDVDRLDPDLACMQSIALQAKLRIQRDRNFERNRQKHQNWLERRLKDAIKQIAS